MDNSETCRRQNKRPIKSAKLAVVELEKADREPQGTEKELRASILSLQQHPGFAELLRRMRVSRAILRSRLESDSEDDNRHILRGLIQAYSFCERQLKAEVGRVPEEAQEAYADERTEYERLARYVEIIGRNQNAN